MLTLPVVKTINMIFFEHRLTHSPKRLMRTRTTALTAQELARYLGSQVLVLDEGTGVKNRQAKLVAVNVSNEEIKVCFDESREVYELTPDAIRPIRRRLTSISLEEARHCFKAAYNWDKDTELLVTFGNDYIELSADLMTLIITTRGVISSSRDSGYSVAPARINARATLTYLDLRGFDLDGLIDAGLSVENETM